MNYTKFNYSEGVIIPCPSCKRTERNGLYTNSATIKNCQHCHKMFCTVCVDGHTLYCAEKPKPEPSSRSMNFGGTDDVSENPAKNCCKCGKARNRKGIIWSIFTPNTNCNKCGKMICSFCNVGMTGKKMGECLTPNIPPSANAFPDAYDSFPLTVHTPVLPDQEPLIFPNTEPLVLPDTEPLVLPDQEPLVLPDQEPLVLTDTEPLVLTNIIYHND